MKSSVVYRQLVVECPYCGEFTFLNDGKEYDIIACESCDEEFNVIDEEN